MRAKIAAIILALLGMAIAAELLVGDRILSPAQLEKVRTVCPECHGEVPEYDRVARVHRKHAAFDCSSCHQGQSGLETTNKIHAVIEKAGIGTMLLALLGIVANILTIKRKGGAN